MVPGDRYRVFLDPAFTPTEVDAALSASENLMGEIPDLSLTITVSACSGTHAGEICIHRGMRADQAGDPTIDGYTWTTGECPDKRGDSGGLLGIDGGETWIDVEHVYGLVPSYPKALQHTFEHEMGHAMGLKHHPGALMGANFVGASMEATCDDAAQYYFIRYRSAPDCKP